ncbi:hypothetical protein ACSS6W_010750 [Trichoderma asperelloides]
MATQQLRQKDIEELEQLNLKYLNSDQTPILQDTKLYSREEFLDMISKPRPFTELSCHDVNIGLFGDGNVALVRANMSFRNLEGKVCYGRYTDEYQRQNGKWVCIGANVICNEN